MPRRDLEPQGRGSIPAARFFAVPIASPLHAPAPPQASTTPPVLTPMSSRGLEPQSRGSIHRARFLVTPLASQPRAIALHPRSKYARPGPAYAHAHAQQRLGTARSRFDSSRALFRRTPRFPASRMLPPRPKHAQTPPNAHVHVQQRLGTARLRFDSPCALSRRTPLASQRIAAAPPQTRPAPSMPEQMHSGSLELQGRGSIPLARSLIAPLAQQSLGTARLRFGSP